MFIHLNVKSCFSLMNGFNKIDNVLEKTARMKSNAVAITDINTMHTFYDFEQAALKKTKKTKSLKRDSIHPIFGITFIVKARYVENEFFNITLLAKNEIGYQHLIALSTIANTNHEQFAYLTFEDLKHHGEGLFCLSGGEEGEVFDLVVNDRIDEAVMLLKDLKAFFGENLYLEVSNHFMKEEEKFIESGIIEKALSIGIDYVATNNAYYLRKEDAQYRSLAVSMNSELNSLKANEVDWIHNYASRHVDFNSEWYLKTEVEMTKAFSKYLLKYPNLLENTLKIANACQATVPKLQTFPEFPLPQGYTEESYFRELMPKGFEERFPDDSAFDPRFTRQDYIDRMEYEFETVKEMGFLGYLLIVQDYINFAKDEKVFKHPERYFPRNCYPEYSRIPEGILKKNYKIAVGPGRGSGAGSLLCYLLKITNLEPLSLDLLFERFLNIERVSMPKLVGHSV